MLAEPLLDRIAGTEGASAFLREFQLTVGAVPPALIEVAAFRGEESMSELYAFDVVAVVAPATAALFRIGDPARLTLPTVHLGRSFHGIVSEIARVASDTGSERIRVRIVPLLYVLTKRTSTRVFQDMTVDAIAAQVLAEHGVPFQMRLSAPHEPRPYAIQYSETDYDFLSRIFAEEGLAFWFEHPPLPADVPPSLGGAREILVVADSPSGYPADVEALAFRPGLAALTTPDVTDVTAFRRLERLEPTAVELRRYDFMRASSNAGQVVSVVPNAIPVHRGGVASQARHDDAPRAGAVPLEWYEPHGHEHGLRVDSDILERKLAQLRVRSDTCWLKTSARGLGPGSQLVVEGQDVAGMSPLVALHVVHHGNLGDHGRRYEAEVVAAPRGVLGCRPVPPRRMVQVVESAVVVGPEGADIETDAYGRVKIQFHWDRDQPNDGTSSCWIRVAQPWSGAQYGFQFIPRVGTEVLVSFLGGDPDRPVVVACLPNLANPLPFAVPDQVTKSGIRTQSTPGDSGAGYNELSFDDRSGQELVHLRAQKNHEVVVLGNQTERIGGSQATSVAVDRTIEVDGADSLRVTRDRATLVSGDDHLTILGGANGRVAADRAVEVGGNDKVAAAGALLSEAGGEVRIQAGVKRPSNATIVASGESRIVGAAQVRLHSPTGVEIRSGDSVLSLTPAGITLRTKAIKLIATEAIELTREATQIKLSDKLDVGSQEIKLETQQASLALTATNAELHGVAVKLGGAKGQKRTAPRQDDAQTKPATFQIKRPQGYDGPLTAVVSLPSGEVVEKSVDASGTLSFDGFDGDEFHILEIRMGDERVGHAGSD
ncbi:type VI secretion system Vgr family protein [Sorangium sp. So ce1024]|uniref:type VI secretion system Vgr family protein n=1 Tax=Sorangium sp. So ce1024 TaxID=3133327 RepID=UPI003F11B6DA